MTSPRPHSTALLVFLRSFDREQKRFGLGAIADRLAHNAVLHHTLQIAREACAQQGAALVLAHDGQVPVEDAQHHFTQQGSDFEASFLHAVRTTFALGYARVVVIGGDTPGLSAAPVTEALAADGRIIGPSQDGGFYLFGMKPGDDALLTGLPWGTPQVLQQLLTRLAASGERFAVLERLDDLDDVTSATRQRALLASLVWEVLGVELTNALYGAAPAPQDAAPAPTPPTEHTSSRGPPLLCI